MASAVWFTAKRQAEILQADPRPVGQDDIKVRAIASAVSHGTEMTVYRGEAPLDQDVAPKEIMEGSYSFPIKYGYQSVGRVIEAGTNSGYREGELVFVHYPHQDVFTVNARAENVVYRLPAYKDPSIGVLSALLNVAVNVMLDVPIRLGDVVVVFGQGVVGNFCGQLARKTCSKLVVVDPIPARRDLALKLGADVAVAPEEAVSAVRKVSDGRGADITIEASGAPSALQAGIDATGFEGTVVVPSWYGTRRVDLFLSPDFHMNRLRIVSSQVNVIGSGLQPRWTLERRMAVVMELLPSLHPDELITHRLPFEKAAEGYRLVDENPAAVMAVAFEYE